MNSVDVPIGKDHKATINEPERGQFSNNLGGAIEYSLTHLVYKLLEITGGGLGAFLGGAGVHFLEAVEPSLVIYARPVIDMVLEQKDLDPHLREFFTLLRDPVHEGAATILAGLATQASGAVTGSLIGAASKKFTQEIERLLRGSIPGASEAFTMAWRGLITDEEANYYAASAGYPDSLINAYKTLAVPRPGVGDLFTSAYRGQISFDSLNAELKRRGFSDESIQVFFKNQQAILDLGPLITLMHRGLLTHDDVIVTMSKQAYSVADIELLIKALEPLPNVQDLISFSVREAYNEGVVQKWGYDQDYPAEYERDMKLLGYDPIWAKRWWRTHWELPSVQLGQEMTHRGIITPDEFADLLRVADYPAGWRSKMQEVIYSPFTRVDVRRMYGMGILNADDVVRAYKDIGYDDEKAAKLADYTIKYEDENGNSKKDTLNSLSESIIRSAVSKGMMSDGDAETQLIALLYTPEDAELLIRLAHWQAAVADKPAVVSQFKKDMQNITERAYLNGIIDTPTAKAQLTQASLSSDEADFDLQAVDYARVEKEQEDALTLISQAYLNGAISRVDTVTRLGALDLPAEQQARVLDKWDAILLLPNRRLTESQYRAAFKMNLITADDYTQAMYDLGYSEYDVALLTQMYVVAPEAPPTEGA